MKKKALYIALIANLTIYAQTFIHEVGFFLGPVATQTDYGERGDFKSNTGNIGLSIGATHTLSFYSGRSYFEENIRLRTEFSFASTTLIYHGAYVAPSETSYVADQLRAMKGKASYINIGSQLEFDFVNIRGRRNDISFYGTAGAMYTFGTSKVSSSLGNINSSGVLPAFLTDDPDEYRNASFETFAATLGLGVNLELNRNTRVFAAYRTQFFFSDWVDGLNAKNFEPNKNNDAAAQISFGVAFGLSR